MAQITGICEVKDCGAPAVENFGPKAVCADCRDHFDAMLDACGLMKYQDRTLNEKIDEEWSSYRNSQPFGLE